MRPCAQEVDSPKAFQRAAISNTLDVQRFIELRLHKKDSEPHTNWF